MKRYLPAALGLGLCLVAAGCPNSREGLKEQEITLLEDVTDVLRTINTQETFNAAKPKLDELLRKHKGIHLRTKRLKKPTDEEKESMHNKFTNDVANAKSNLTKELKRLDNLEGGPEMQRKINDMMKLIQ
jgi:hypothetical protein